MPFDWLLKRPTRDGCVRYEDWILWHYYTQRIQH